MKRLLILFSILISSIIYADKLFDEFYFSQEIKLGPPAWYSVAGYPVNRIHVRSCEFDGKLWGIGGQDPSGWVDKTNVYYYDGSTWTESIGLPVAASQGAVVIWDNKITYFRSGGGATNVYQFNGSTWTETIGLAGPNADSLNEKSGAVIYEGWVYFAQGYYTTNMVRWNGSTSEEILGLPNNIQFWGGGIGVFNGRMFVAPGASQTNFYRWETNSWSAMAGLPAANRNWSMISRDSGIWLLGRQSGSTNVYVFNGTSWSATNSHPVAWWIGGLSEYNDSLYTIGGAIGGSYGPTNVWRFGP